jgi:hypothetical protein
VSNEQEHPNEGRLQIDVRRMPTSAVEVLRRCAFEERITQTELIRSILIDYAIAHASKQGP